MRTFRRCRHCGRSAAADAPSCKHCGGLLGPLQVDFGDGFNAPRHDPSNPRGTPRKKDSDAS